MANHTTQTVFRSGSVTTACCCCFSASPSQTILARYDQNPGSSGVFAWRTISCLACRTRLLARKALAPGRVLGTTIHVLGTTINVLGTTILVSSVLGTRFAPRGYRATRNSQPPTGRWKRADTLKLDHTDTCCSWRCDDREWPNDELKGCSRMNGGDLVTGPAPLENHLGPGGRSFGLEAQHARRSKRMATPCPVNIRSQDV